MKLLDLIKSANHNLMRNKTRTILTILAIFIGSFTIILNTAINTGANDFIDSQIESTGGEGYLEMTPNAIADNMSSMLTGDGYVEYNENTDSKNKAYITDEMFEKAKTIDGMESIDRIHSAEIDYITSDSTDKKFKLSNLNLVPRGSINLDLLAGRKPNSESNDLEISLTRGISEALGFKDPEDALGKTVTFAVPNTIKCYAAASRQDCQKTISATVVGVQAPGIMSMGGARANLRLYEKIYELNSEGMSEEVRNRAYQATAQVDPKRIDEIKDKLKEIGLTAVGIDDYAGMIRAFFDAVLVLFNIFGVIALLAAAIGIINTLFMSVQERTREIGLLKALGMGGGKIFLEFSLEAIMLGFWGSAIGIGVSILLGLLGNQLASQTFLADFPTFTLAKFEPIPMITIVLIIMFIAFIAGTIPARKASKKDPITALRYE